MSMTLSGIILYKQIFKIEDYLQNIKRESKLLRYRNCFVDMRQNVKRFSL